MRKTGDPFYKSARWRAVRAAVLLEAGHLCQRCREAGRRVPARIVHHVKPIRDGGARLDRANLMPVCSRCHDELHAELDAAAGRGVNPEREAWDKYIARLMAAEGDY